MSTDERVVRGIFAPHDPAAAVRVGEDQRARARVAALAAAASAPPRAHRRAGRGRWMLLAAAGAAAALTVAGTVAVNTAAPAYAGPPPPPLAVVPAEVTDADEELLALADRAEDRPPVRGEGADVAYVHTSEWTLTMSQNADTDEEGWGVLPVDREVWRSLDDSGYAIERPQPPEHLSGDPDPLSRLFGEGPTEEEWGEGEGGNGMFLTWKPDTLPTDPDELAARLSTVDGVPSGGSARLFTALQTLYSEMPVDPEVQAAALRALADRDDVRFAGTATDREGREGLLFLTEDRESSEGEVLQRRIMFDPDTGMPLYHETVVVRSEYRNADELPIVNHYAALVETAWVSEVHEAP
ncbi:CU044_5270 family protein [Streptomonospora nanhaiensis]|uniref:CU044_5270 family protein n=1 Tax=Streptomonospora nanhaiensis TaxID=1323731 RepID=A0A853BLY2_9ACTN|nr:CU044_5270 family protein [Streptomonospora nanhaiensis]MBV2363339.1 CU044_5270 family protein [Streptomonospora nanhaiensis]NYI95704.1 hypothetical protein [Streptomonospora nanhaiensis]